MIPRGAELSQRGEWAERRAELRPGNAGNELPRSTTSVPSTITYGMPSETWRGPSKVGAVGDAVGVEDGETASALPDGCPLALSPRWSAASRSSR